MELDDLKQAWQGLDARVGVLERECARWLSDDGRIRHALRPMRWTSAMMWYELLGNGVILVLLGVFIARQDQWRFIAPALLLFLATLAMSASNVAQRGVYAALDYGAGVVAIQSRLEWLCMLRWRTAQMVYRRGAGCVIPIG